MIAAAGRLIGRHDFACFEASGSPRASTVRTVTDLTIERQGLDPLGPFDPSRLVIEIEADGFLYNMVRNIVGTLVDVGAGRRPAEWISEVLSACDRQAAGQTAPPQGLLLLQVEIKAGTKILSARHKTEHPFIVSKGKVLVITEDGTRQVIEAPHMGITIPGTRRALHALEDTIWTTFHPTEEKDIEKICEGLIEPETDSSLLQWQDSLPKIAEPCHS